MKKQLGVIFLIFLFLLPCVVVSATDDPDIEITIERGCPIMYGYEITIYNNKSVSVNASYHAEMFGFFPLRHIRHEGNKTVTRHSNSGIDGFFFSALPRFVTVSCICEKEGKVRSGIIIGPYIIFGTYKDMVIPST
jgi:hypothetical protein